MTNEGKAITSPQEYKKFLSQQEQADSIRIADMIDQMSTPKGRRIMWRMLKDLLYQEPVMDVGASVYGKVARQAVAIQNVKEMKKVCRDLFYTMEIENDGLER